MPKGLKWPLIVLSFGLVAVAVIGHGYWLPWVQGWLDGSGSENRRDALSGGTSPSLDQDSLTGQETDEAPLSGDSGKGGAGEDAEPGHPGRGDAAGTAALQPGTSGNGGKAGTGAESATAGGAAAGETPEAEVEPEPEPIETVEGQQINPNVSGALGEVSGVRIKGWLKDKFEPEAELYVEIQIDDRVVYDLRASAKQDHKTLGIIWWFEQPEPEQLQDAERHVVRALAYRKDQHGKTELSGSPRVKTVGAYSQGKLEEATPENGITGYAWDPDTPNKPVKVIVRIDGETISELNADAKNEELKKRKIAPSDTCAFSVPWPNQLDDGNEHTVQVFAIDSATGDEHEIDGSPRVITSRSGLANSAPIGGFDICNKVVLAGWAWDADAGAAAVDVEIWIDNELFAQVPANSKRDTLYWSKVTPDPMHGFVTTTPTSLLDGKTHTVRAYALNSPAGVKVELDGSPRQYRVEENSDPMGGFWADAKNVIHGWAADPDLNTEPCEIEIYIDDKLHEKRKANEPANWLIGSGFAPNAEHGFNIQPPEFTLDGNNHEVRILAINFPSGPAKELGRLTIGVATVFAGFWTSDKLLDTRVDKGLYVSGVSPWYDAYHKDVKVGDVLLEYDGIIAGTAEVKDKDGKVTTPGTMTADFRAWLNKNKKKGDVVHFKFWRDGETYEADIKLGEIIGR